MKIVVDGDKVRTDTPYSEKFKNAAPQIGGKWDRNTCEWVFDARDEDRVRQLAAEVYGHDGRDYSDEGQVTVRVALDAFARKQRAFGFGEEVAGRGGRDWRVKLMRGAVVVEGEFPASGGSRNYPALASKGAVVEVRDVPLPVAQMTIECLEAQAYNPEGPVAWIVGELPHESMTEKEFDALLYGFIAAMDADELLTIPGVKEAVSEHLNKD